MSMTTPRRGRAATGDPAAPSCHEGGCGAAPVAGSPVVALVGAPNCGKSTLFNALTGGRRTVGNWPGTTVEIGRGGWRAAGTDLELIDLPGAYSLDACSPDEELTPELLVDRDALGRPEVAVVVADAVHLARSLYLVAQLRETDQPVVVALTMLDVARRRGIAVDVAALGEHLGVPVVPLDARRRQGVAELAEAVRDAVGAGRPTARPRAAAVDPADELAVADERFGWISAATDAAVRDGGSTRRTVSDRIDRWATSRGVGPLLFLAVMWCVFQLTTAVAAPLQDGLGAFFSGPVTRGLEALLGAVGLGGSWVELFLVDGLLAGVGMLLTFVPLMVIMFLLLALLEDSGYLARAAVVTDRVMSRIGLPGRPSCRSWSASAATFPRSARPASCPPPGTGS